MVEIINKPEPSNWCNRCN